MLYFHRRPGLIDIITSFPILIIMIWMKVTGNVSSWIVKLPAFRIYILLPLGGVLLHRTSRDSFIPHVAAPRNSSNSQRVCGSSHLFTPQIIHFIPLLLMYSPPRPIFSHTALFQTLEHSEWAAQGLELDMITSLSTPPFLPIS